MVISISLVIIMVDAGIINILIVLIGMIMVNMIAITLITDKFIIINGIPLEFIKYYFDGVE